MPSLHETLLAQDAYKTFESEGFCDAYFYRPAGCLFALAGKALRLSPNHLTSASLVTGISGAMLLYRDDRMLYGIGLLILSGVFDASDGQLARMTGSASLLGRIIDGAADYLVYFAVYLTLAFKYLKLHPDASPVWIFVLMVAAGISHSIQSSLFDYYRNEYTDYIAKRRIPAPTLDETKTEFESSFLKKLLEWSHRDYMARQRRLARSHAELGGELRKRLPSEGLSDDFADSYRRFNLPLIRLWNLLGANSRLWVTAAAVLAGRPELYFWTELTLYNSVLATGICLQTRADRALLRTLSAQKG